MQEYGVFEFFPLHDTPYFVVVIVVVSEHGRYFVRVDKLTVKFSAFFFTIEQTTNMVISQQPRHDAL